jgi:hypothetical protein
MFQRPPKDKSNQYLLKRYALFGLSKPVYMKSNLITVLFWYIILNY